MVISQHLFGALGLNGTIFAALGRDYDGMEGFFSKLLVASFGVQVLQCNFRRRTYN